MPTPVLIVEDDPMQRQMLSTLLRRKMDYGSCVAENGQEALKLLETEIGKDIKLIIMDLDMPIMGGIETLEIVKQKYPALPVIMLTGSKDIEDAVQAMKLGAIDFLTKPYEGDRMAVTVKNALKMSTLTREISRLTSEKQGTLSFENLIGHDNGLLKVIHTARKAANADIPVLITGETGTGKEVFAQAIHGESARNGKPFVAVNCGAIPAQLVESTLFGHEKGAFTGATDKVIGKFREAEGGTIFLDEVGELPLDAQVKLLRVLQQREVEPVGAGKPLPVNIRIISATNRDLQTEVEEGRFREDLYFRLNVLQIEIPPLRDRRQDIPQLAHHFIERFCVNNGFIPKTLSDGMRQKLMAYDWPGNVRQLENAIHRATIMNDGNELDIHDFAVLFEDVGRPDNQVQIHTKPSDIQVISEDGTIKTSNEIEQEAIKIVLEHCNGNITKSANTLGMAKSTFYKKMKHQT